MFTECDIQARDSQIDFGSRIVLRQATKKASCEVNQSDARYNGCRAPTLNIARNEELFWRIRASHWRIPRVRERDLPASLDTSSATGVINTHDFAIIELLSSRKKYVAKYRRDSPANISRRFVTGDRFTIEKWQSCQRFPWIVVYSRTIRVECLERKKERKREYRVLPLVHSVNREGGFLVDPETER